MYRLPFILAFAFAAYAQPAVAQNDEEDLSAWPLPDVHFIELHYAQCDQVATILNKFFSDDVSGCDHRTGLLMYYGPTGHLDKAKDFVAQLDVPEATPEQEEDFKLIPLRHRDTEAIYRHVSTLVPNHSVRRDGRMIQSSRIAADASRSAILVRGDVDSVRTVQEIIEGLDTPESTVQLEFAFLAAKATGDIGHLPPVPDDLADVAAELARFGKISLLCRAMTTAVEGERFKIEGGIGVEFNAAMNIKGRLLHAAEKGTVKLGFDAEVVMRPPPLDHDPHAHPPASNEPEKPKKAAHKIVFRLETVVTTQRGDYLVVGSSPAGRDPGESLILVLHVPPDR